MTTHRSSQRSGQRTRISIVARNSFVVAGPSWRAHADSCRYVCHQMLSPAGRRVVLGGRHEWLLCWRSQFAHPGELPANYALRRTVNRSRWARVLRIGPYRFTLSPAKSPAFASTWNVRTARPRFGLSLPWRWRRIADSVSSSCAAAQDYVEVHADEIRAAWQKHFGS